MAKLTRTALALAIALAAPGCAMLEPRLPQAEAGIPASWPLPAEGVVPVEGAPAVADVGWREFFADPRLEQVIALALENNRDLRVALLNVERARAQYRIVRADRLPALGVSGQMERVGGDIPTSEEYSVTLGVSAFELDLFGRVRNLSQAALQQYLATEQNQRAAQLALVAQVAGSWLSLGADQQALAIARETLATYEQSLALSEKMHELGATSALQLNQTRTLVESARADVARYSGQVAQGSNALNLLVGQSVDASLLPQRLDVATSGLAALPAGLDSQVLLRRPDISAAEHALRAANANIGAARAAFFPSIRLTGGIGSVSNELSGLFESGTRVWSFVPQVSIPIFQGGRLRANLGMANAERDIALAQYEKAIQAGFREVADALALSQTLAEQREAMERLVAAAQQAHDLSEARYNAGMDSFLTLLDARRSLYSARQGLVAVQLAEQANRISLYKALGGGWLENSPAVQAP